MRYGSVCSGVEAATMAWHPLGWEPAFFSEIEQFPREVLKHRYPEVPLHGDFTTIGADDYGTIDLLVGGTPCQSFSVAGLRGGMDDDRGNLALEFLRLAQRKRPTWVVWENVPGVLSSNGGRDFGSFLGGLGELGYGWAYRVLDAQYFGVAQRRRRVFVVGYLGNSRVAQAVLFERHSLQGHPAPSRKTQQGATPDVAKCLAGNSGGIDREDRHTLIPDWPAEVACTLDAKHAKHYGQDNQHINSGASLFVPGVTVMSSGQANAEISDEVSPTLNCNRDGSPIAFAVHGTQDPDVRDEHAHTLGRNSGQENAIAIRTSNTNANGHGLADEVTHTLDQTQGQAVAFTQNQRNEVREVEVPGALAAQPGMKQQTYLAENMAVRRLTPIECERLQGFPDDFTRIPYRKKDPVDCPDGPRYKAMGNSMAVPVMAWIGNRVSETAACIFEATGDDRKHRQAKVMGETE